MRLLTAQLVLDRVNMDPANTSATRFFEDKAQFTLRIQKTDAGTIAYIDAPGVTDAYAHPFNPDNSPAEEAFAAAEWMCFVVNMTLCIRELTNA
jgi:hypothetical protein